MAFTAYVYKIKETAFKIILNGDDKYMFIYCSALIYLYFNKSKLKLTFFLNWSVYMLLLFAILIHQYLQIKSDYN